MSYESPITIIRDIADKMNTDIESHIYQSVLKIGIDVNKEELVRALQYDRNQYEKGYADGKKQAVVHARWEVWGTFDDFLKCSNCEWDTPISTVYERRMNYCPNCGAKMDEEEKQEC